MANGTINGTIVKAIGRRVLGIAFDLVTPDRCRLCGGPLFDHANPYLCPECLAGVPWIGPGACRGCGFPAGPGASLGGNCRRCAHGRLRLDGAAAVARYRGGAKRLVKALKFRGETRLAAPMAGLMAERYRNSHFFGAVDVLLPVSLHGERLLRRGFDQSVLLARTLSGLTALPVREGTLRRTRTTSPQANLRRAERLINLDGVFEAAEKLDGERVLLIDDVLTTGATVADCARACRQAGAARVYALTFAR